MRRYGALTVIAATNQLIDAIPVTSNVAYLSQVAQVKQLAQGAVAEQLDPHLMGVLNIVVVVANGPHALAAQVAAALTPPTLIVPASFFAEATSAAGPR